MCSNYIVKEIELTDISSLVVLEGLFDSLYRDPKILYIDEFIINVHFSNEKNLLDGISIIKKYRFGIFLKLPMVNIFLSIHKLEYLNLLNNTILDFITPNGIVRVFWEISTPLELLEGTLLYEQAQPEDLFDKIFEPRGLLAAKAGYIHQHNYQIKQDIFNNELVDDEEYYKQQGILNVNDEAIMFDVIIDELSKVHPLYARIRL